MASGCSEALRSATLSGALVPKRLTPGWESRISRRSLAAIYAVLALSLPLRGLLRLR